jgi:hypothetical protein
MRTFTTLRIATFTAPMAALLALVALLLSGTVDAARKAPPAPTGPQASAGAVKAFKAAQALVDKQDFAGALNALAPVEAMADRLPADTYFLNRFKGVIYIREGVQDYRKAADAYEANLLSGLLPAAEIPSTLQLVAQLNMATKPAAFAKSVEYATRFLDTVDAGDLKMLSVATESSYFLNDFAKATVFGERGVKAAAAAGKVPAENTLLILQRSYAKSNDVVNTNRASAELVRHYPKPEYWQPLANNLLREAGTDKRRVLNVFRLMDGLGLMESPADYLEMADTALDYGFPGEARRVLEAGFASKVLPGNAKARSEAMRLDAKSRAATDLADLPRQDKDARARKQGEADITLGEAYLSHGQGEKALEALQRGLAKGGVKSLDDAHLALGRALLGLGRKDEARAAFAQVTGKDVSAIAELWGLSVRPDAGAK